MKNLDQIRAQSALNSRENVQHALDLPGQGDSLSGFPMLIIQCGLLSAFAFAIERKPNGSELKHPADHAIASAIVGHLAAEGVTIADSASPRDLIEELANEDSDHKLRRATAEGIAFLNYLKRFVA